MNDNDDDFGDFAAPQIQPQLLSQPGFQSQLLSQPQINPSLQPQFEPQAFEPQAIEPQSLPKSDLPKPPATFFSTLTDDPGAVFKTSFDHITLNPEEVSNPVLPTLISKPPTAQSRLPPIDFTSFEIPPQKSKAEKEFAAEFKQEAEVEPKVTLETFANFNAAVKSANFLQPETNKSNNDKYSALRDLLGSDNDLSKTDDNSNPNLNDEEDDFGDFVATTDIDKTSKSLLPDESIVKPSHSNLTTPISTNVSIFKTKNEVTTTIPWLESSPPPPPDEIIEDHFEEMNTEGFFHEQDSNLEPTVTSLELHNQDISIASLNLRSLTPKLEEMGLNLPNDNNQSSFETKLDENIVEKVAKAALEILTNATEIFIDIDDKDVKNEVLNAKETESLVWNLIQVYRVFKRIQTSHEKNSSGSGNEIFQNVNKTWRTFLKLIVGKSTLIPNNSVWDFAESSQNNNNYASSKLCHICNLDVNKSSKETHSKLVESVITYQNKPYHSICINFWLNAVNEDLSIIE